MMPKGFLAAGVGCGIKKNRKKDFAIIYSENPCKTSVLFTTNKIKAAPVKISIRAMREKKKKAIIVNSGVANACTGKQGLKDALAIQAHAAKELKTGLNEILVMSTGIIGKRLPVQLIKRGVKKAVFELGSAGLRNAAEAIMTTDTRKKIVLKKIWISKKKVTIAGIAKGSGMIAPNMATMLAIVITDAAISQALLEKLWKSCCDATFNSITVDGDMSTNDCAAIMSSGEAGNKELKAMREAKNFSLALGNVCLALAKKIVADGEGSTKLITVKVAGAKSGIAAKKISMRIANSNLVKTAIYGNDANWGRIIAAIGASGSGANEKGISIFLGKICVFKNGNPLKFNENNAENYLKHKSIEIKAVMGQGNGEHTAYTCDLTEKYIGINASYRS
ncbi:bifunctional glutamate N-acetyltransferase/amino-acid acetyltransferase ArgJ [Candidatus Woesearchaeota archaeon]|nr:bifunctional glutamate N-acetyltransferase/amino-acid acetyltransferase ArgJ [Candidatus Woesearchaeota archaeon]